MQNNLGTTLSEFRSKYDTMGPPSTHLEVPLYGTERTDDEIDECSLGTPNVTDPDRFDSAQTGNKRRVIKLTERTMDSKSEKRREG